MNWVSPISQTFSQEKSSGSSSSQPWSWYKWTPYVLEMAGSPMVAKNVSTIAWVSCWTYYSLSSLSKWKMIQHIPTCIWVFRVSVVMVDNSKSEQYFIGQTQMFLPSEVFLGSICYSMFQPNSLKQKNWGLPLYMHMMLSCLDDGFWVNQGWLGFKVTVWPQLMVHMFSVCGGYHGILESQPGCGLLSETPSSVRPCSLIAVQCKLFTVSCLVVRCFLTRLRICQESFRSSSTRTMLNHTDVVLSVSWRCLVLWWDNVHPGMRGLCCMSLTTNTVVTPRWILLMLGYVGPSWNWLKEHGME